MQIQLANSYADVGIYLEGNEAKALIYKPLAIKKIKDLFALANGGTMPKDLDFDNVKIRLKVQGNTGKLRIVAGGFWLYQKKIETGKTAVWVADIPKMDGNATTKDFFDYNIHTFTDSATAIAGDRWLSFKANGRNQVWRVTFQNASITTHTVDVVFELVQTPDDRDGHSASAKVDFRGTNTRSGYPVIITPYETVQTREQAVFATKDKYATLSCVRYGTDGEYQQNLIYLFGKDRKYIEYKQWTDDYLFDLSTTGLPAGSWVTIQLQKYGQGNGGVFYGVALRSTKNNTSPDPVYGLNVRANKRTIIDPTAELQLPEAEIITMGGLSPAAYNDVMNFSYVSNIYEHSGKIFVTVGAWNVDDPGYRIPDGSDVNNIPYYNGYYKYHTAVWDVKTGVLLAIYHDTGIGEWSETEYGIVGMTTETVKFTVSGGSVTVHWGYKIFKCGFSKGDPNLIEKAAVTDVYKGYSGTFSQPATFINTIGALANACNNTANLWSKSNPTHVMHKPING